MKFSKYNNPNRRRSSRRRHSAEYVRQMQEKLYAELAKCKTDAERELIIKAYDVSMNP